MPDRPPRATAPAAVTRPLAAALAAALSTALGACATDPLPTAPTPVARAVRADLSPGVGGAGDNAVLRWDAALLQAVRVARLGPPVVARAVGVTHTAIYDAWAAYDPVALGTQYGGALRRPAAERTDANKQRAVSYAAYRALADLFPAQRPAFDGLMASLGYAPGDTLDGAAAVGTAAARALLAARHHDGSNQLGDLGPSGRAYADYAPLYAPANTPDALRDATRWQPLRVDGVVQQFVAPHWGRVLPFALSAGDQFRPPPPRTTTLHGGFVQEVEDMLHTSARLTPEQKVIAEYWADGPNSELPPGHWCLFGAWVSRRDHHGLDEDARMFFALGNAVMDAGIAAWDAKRAYDAARPITTVRYWKAGKPVWSWGGPGLGTVKMSGERWLPYQPANVVTPAFPEYVSGHSTFSAAAATVLATFTGSDVLGASATVDTLRADRVKLARPVTLAWPTFSAAADEAGLSRRYGGIHFAEGDLAGRALGRRVGAAVWARAAGYWTGARGPASVAGGMNRNGATEGRD